MKHHYKTNINKPQKNNQQIKILTKLTTQKNTQKGECTKHMYYFGITRCTSNTLCHKF
jgi:hypothetical protein